MRMSTMKCKNLHVWSCTVLVVVVCLQVFAGPLLIRESGQERHASMVSRHDFADQDAIDSSQSYFEEPSDHFQGASAEMKHVDANVKGAEYASFDEITQVRANVGASAEIKQGHGNAKGAANATFDEITQVSREKVEETEAEISVVDRDLNVRWGPATPSEEKHTFDAAKVVQSSRPRVLLWNRYYVEPLQGNLTQVERLLKSRDAGNIGNLVWQYAGSYCIFDAEKVEVVEIWPENPSLTRDDFDVHMMPVANMLWPIDYHNISYHQELDEHLRYVSFMRKIVSETARPSFMYGLGIQGYESIGKSATMDNDLGVQYLRPRTSYEYVLHAEYIRMLASVAKHSQAIGVRGDFTRQVCGNYGVETVTLGCPSLFINPEPTLGATVQSMIEKLPSNPRLVIMMPALYGLNYIRLYFDMLDRNPENVIMLQGITDYDFIKLAEKDLNTTIPESRLRFFSDFPTWSKFVCGYEAIVGARIHGAMIGLGCPIPILLMPTDLRTDELGRSMRIPIVSSNHSIFFNVPDRPKEIKLKDLFAIANFSGTAFDANRKVIAKQYASILQSMGMPASKTIRDLSLE